MRTILLTWLVLGCLIATASLGAAGDDKKQDKKRKPKFTINKETTYVTEAVDADGFIDYPAALNERLKKGVTPENNAYVLLVKAMGPHPEGSTMPPEFYRWLGIRPPSEKGEYFVAARQFLKAQYDEKNPDFFDDSIDQASQRPWTARQRPDLAEWLKANEKPLALAVEAAGRPQFFYPLVPGKSKDGSPAGLIGALVPGVQKCRDLAQALSIRAMLSIGEERWDDARRDLLALHRLGRLLGRGGTLIEFLVGVAVESIACDRDLVLLASPKLNAAKIIAYQRELQDLPPRSTVADKLDLGERFMFLDSTMLIARGGFPFLESLASPGANPKTPNPAQKTILDNIDWDPALRNGNRYYDRMVASLRIKERSEREKEAEALDIEIKDVKAKLFMKSPIEKLGSLFFPLGFTANARGKFIGDILISLLMPAHRKVQQAADRIEQIEQNLHIAFALAGYQRDIGSYPPRLDALTPKYLKEIPLDLFTGRPLIYQPAKNGYLLYSVGVNGKDDGGQGYNDNPPGDDLVVRMPLPELRK